MIQVWSRRVHVRGILLSIIPRAVGKLKVAVSARPLSTEGATAPFLHSTVPFWKQTNRAKGSMAPFSPWSLGAPLKLIAGQKIYLAMLKFCQGPSLNPIGDACVCRQINVFLQIDLEIWSLLSWTPHPVRLHLAFICKPVRPVPRGFSSICICSKRHFSKSLIDTAVNNYGCRSNCPKPRQWYC